MKLNNYIIKHFTTLSCLKLSRIFHFSTDGEIYIRFNLIVHYICCNEISGFYIWLNKVIYCLFVLELRLTLKISSKPFKIKIFKLYLPSSFIRRGRSAADADSMSAPGFKEKTRRPTSVSSSKELNLSRKPNQTWTIGLSRIG